MARGSHRRHPAARRAVPLQPHAAAGDAEPGQPVLAAPAARHLAAPGVLHLVTRACTACQFTAACDLSICTTISADAHPSSVNTGG